MDTVISCVPEADATVDKDTAVTLTVSGGEAVVPDLYMMTLGEAEAYVTDAQLIFSGKMTYVDTEEPENHGKVVSQTPEADSHVVLQTAVNLSVYRSPERVRRQEIEVTVPETAQDVNVLVTLQAVGSSVEWNYVSYVCTADKGRTQLVTVELPDERSYVCYVYQDGVRTQRTEIEGE